MPRDRQMRERRREAILEIIREGTPVANQVDMVRRLQEKGFQATQSSVSRDMRDLGVVWVKGRYVISTWSPVDEIKFQLAISFVREMNPAGPHLIVVTTVPGTARIVATAIDGMGWQNDIVGTVAGDDTVFIAVPTVRSQKKVLQQLNIALEELDEAVDKVEGEKARGKRMDLAPTGVDGL